MSTVEQKPRVRKLTALQLAAKFFQDAIEQGKDSVSNVDLQQYVAERTHQSREVVHGTLDCTGRGTLIDCKWYTSNWHRERSASGRVIHRRNRQNEVDVTLQREMNFDCEMKRLSCARIMSYLPNTGSPRLLTLASATGNCVQAAVERNPRVQIHNVECRDDVLALWKGRKQSLGVETADYLCTFQDFVRAPGFAETHYDLINADVMGYPCRRMHEYLGAITRAKNADVVALTTQCLSEFRNHGEFQDALRKKYAGSADKQGECIADWLPDYEMVDRYTYRKDEHSACMEVFIFVLNPEG